MVLLITSDGAWVYPHRGMTTWWRGFDLITTWDWWGWIQ